MDKIVLELHKRTEKGKANAKLRAEGMTPGVVYGHGAEPESVKVPTKELTKVFNQAGWSKIIGLKIDGTRQTNALIQDVQHNPLTGGINHADFYLVRMDEKLETEVPLHFIGESTAVYQMEGTLVKTMETLEVRALPGDLPESIEVDISVLDDFEKTIHVSDLKVPKGVEVLADPEELVVKVDAPRSDEEMAALDTEVVEELPEGVADEPVAEEEAGK